MSPSTHKSSDNKPEWVTELSNYLESIIKPHEGRGVVAFTYDIADEENPDSRTLVVSNMTVIGSMAVAKSLPSVAAEASMSLISKAMGMVGMSMPDIADDLPGSLKVGSDGRLTD